MCKYFNNNKGKVKIGDFGLARNIAPNRNKKYNYKVVTLGSEPQNYYLEKLYVGQQLIFGSVDRKKYLKNYLKIGFFNFFPHFEKFKKFNWYVLISRKR